MSSINRQHVQPWHMKNKRDSLVFEQCRRSFWHAWCNSYDCVAPYEQHIKLISRLKFKLLNNVIKLHKLQIMCIISYAHATKRQLCCCYTERIVGWVSHHAVLHKTCCFVWLIIFACLAFPAAQCGLGSFTSVENLSVLRRSTLASRLTLIIVLLFWKLMFCIALTSSIITVFNVNQLNLYSSIITVFNINQLNLYISVVITRKQTAEDKLHKLHNINVSLTRMIFVAMCDQTQQQECNH